MPGHVFGARTTGQVSAFSLRKRRLGIHRSRTTCRLGAAFRRVLDDMGRKFGMDMPILIGSIHDQYLVANDRNLDSCLRVACPNCIESIPHRDA